MATLERVMQLQGQGMSDAQISNLLLSEGVAPKEINDSLNQARVKSAVTSPANPIPSPDPNALAAADPNNLAPQGMQASIGSQSMSDQQSQMAMPAMNQDPMGAQAPGKGMPMTQEMPAAPANAPGPQAYPAEPVYDQSQPAYDANFYQPAPNAYADQGYGADYYGAGNLDTETISEIAEQVASEKLNEFKKQTGDLRSFQNIVNDKLSDLDDRLRRIEDTIAKLQSSIIDKVAEFGQNSSLMHRDLENLHGTVSKLMDPLVDNLNEMKKNNHHRSE